MLGPAAAITVYSWRRHRASIVFLEARIQPMRRPASPYAFDKLLTHTTLSYISQKLGDSTPESSVPRYTSSACSQAPVFSQIRTMPSISLRESTLPVGLLGFTM